MKKKRMEKIQQLISSTLFVDEVQPTEDLFEAGYLDSLGIVSLMVALENEFGITLSLESVDLESFRTVESINQLITPLIKVSA